MITSVAFLSSSIVCVLIRPESTWSLIVSIDWFPNQLGNSASQTDWNLYKWRACVIVMRFAAGIFSYSLKLLYCLSYHAFNFLPASIGGSIANDELFFVANVAPIFVVLRDVRKLSVLDYFFVKI